MNNSYKICHFLSENLIKNFCKDNNFNFLILRPGAVYGFPNNYIVNRTSLIPYSFPNELINNSKITLKSSGNQYRNFCSNNDIGELINKWLNSSKKKSLVSNVNGNETITVKSFANRCMKIYKKIYMKDCKLKLNNKKERFRKLIVNQEFKCEFKSDLNSFLTNIFLRNKINE